MLAPLVRFGNETPPGDRGGAARNDEAAHLLQVEDMKRAAEPIFVWGGGSASDKRVRWEFRNEGGSVSHLTVTLPSPTGVPTGIQADIRPKEWLGNSRDGDRHF